MQWWMSVGMMVAAAVAWMSQGATGTLVVRTDGHLVQPIAIALSGTGDYHVPLDGARTVTVRGLPPGRYDVRPVFAGTVTGAPVHVDLEVAATTEVVLPLSDVGGVRFDADAGLCEPTDAWAFAGIGQVTVSTDGKKVTSMAGKFVPASPWCQREVGGLAPGTYRVQVTPPRDQLPAYVLSFRVQAGEWTQMRLTYPPVVVRGRVTANGEAVPGVGVGFMPTGTAMAIPPRTEPSAFLDVPTDEDGRYASVLRVPGTYTQVVKPRLQDPFPDVAEAVTVAHGVNVNDIEVGAGRLRVWFTEHGASPSGDLTATLSLQSLPRRPLVLPVRVSAEPFEIRVLSPGAYAISAWADSLQPDGRRVSYAASRQQDVLVSSHQTTDVRIDLVPREGTLEVVDLAGSPIEGASVLTVPGTAGIRTDAEGRVSLRTLPVGTRLPIRTRTWGVTCHTVTDDELQRVVVAEASETAVLRVAHGPAGVRPAVSDTTRLRATIGGSTLTGIQGATCPMPIEGFSIAEARVPGALEFSIMLPPGVYTLTLGDGRVMTMQAPGRIDIR